MLEKMRKAVRVSNTAFDDELKDLIDAAKIDLKTSGVNKIETINETGEKVIEDPLIKRAITIYVKANFGWDNPDAERLQELYILLKQHLSLSGDYNVVE